MEKEKDNIPQQRLQEIMKELEKAYDEQQQQSKSDMKHLDEIRNKTDYEKSKQQQNQILQELDDILIKNNQNVTGEQEDEDDYILKQFQKINAMGNEYEQETGQGFLSNLQQDMLFKDIKIQEQKQEEDNILEEMMKNNIENIINNKPQEQQKIQKNNDQNKSKNSKEIENKENQNKDNEIKAQDFENLIDMFDKKVVVSMKNGNEEDLLDELENKYVQFDKLEEQKLNNKQQAKQKENGIQNEEELIQEEFKKDQKKMDLFEDPKDPYEM